MIRTSLTAAALVALTSGAAQAQVTVGVDDSTAGTTGAWLGFMNVFNLPADGGAFQFGSPWGVADLNASFDDGSNTLTLSPNTIGDPDPYWYIGGGGPGAPGNKIMDANLYQQVDNMWAGQTLTFEGSVLSNSFTAAHESFIFIRDFAPDFSSFNETKVPLTPGPFSIDLALDAGPDRHVQWGFQTIGENVWVTDTAPFGTGVIGTIPTPSALALFGAAGLAGLRRRRA